MAIGSFRSLDESKEEESHADDVDFLPDATSLRRDEDDEDDEEEAGGTKARRSRAIVAWNLATRGERGVTKRGWTVDPVTSQFASFWDGVLSAATLFTAIVTPAEVGFQQGFRFNWLFFCNQLVNAIFLMDLVFNFFLHYQLANDDWVRDHRRIVWHYLKTNFFIDLVATFPFEMLALGLGNTCGLAKSCFRRKSRHKGFKGMRLIRVVRLVKLLRLARTSRLIHRYRADLSFSFGFMNVAFFVVASVLSAHWIACAWGVAGQSASDDNSWMTQFRDGDYAWAISSPKNQYLLSLYFSIMTLTTVGYGDVGPKNLSEYALLVFAMLLGGFLWAYIIGAVCGTVANLDRVKIRHQQRYDQINNLLVREQISPDLAHRVRSYLFQTEEVDRHVAYASLISYLSPILQHQLAEALLKANIAKVRYLRHRSLAFQMDIFRKLETKLFCPDERVPHGRDLVFIVNNGYIHADTAGVDTMHARGDALNLDFFLRSHYHPLPVLRSTSYTECQLLSREDLEDVCLHHPRERVFILWNRAFYAARNCYKYKGEHFLRQQILRLQIGDGLVSLGPATTPFSTLKKRGGGDYGDTKDDATPEDNGLPTTVAAATVTTDSEDDDDDATRRRLYTTTMTNVVGVAVPRRRTVDDLQSGLAAARRGDLEACSSRLRDVQILVDTAITHSNAAAFEFASDRLRANPHVLLNAVKAAGRQWKANVLPFAPQALRDLLSYVAEEAAIDCRARQGSGDLFSYNSLPRPSELKHPSAHPPASDDDDDNDDDA